MGAALAEVLSTFPEPQDPPSTACQLSLPLGGLAGTQNATAFCLLMLVQAQMAKGFMAWCSLVPVSTAISWCVAHGDMSLRTAAIRADAASRHEPARSYAIPDRIMSLSPHLGHRVDSGAAAASRAAWTFCIMAVRVAAQQCSPVAEGQGTKQQAAVLLQLLLTATNGEALPGVEDLGLCRNAMLSIFACCRVLGYCKPVRAGDVEGAAIADTGNLFKLTWLAGGLAARLFSCLEGLLEEWHEAAGLAQDLLLAVGEHAHVSAAAAIAVCVLANQVHPMLLNLIGYCLVSLHEQYAVHLRSCQCCFNIC